MAFDYHICYICCGSHESEPGSVPIPPDLIAALGSYGREGAQELWATTEEHSHSVINALRVSDGIGDSHTL